MGQFRHLCARNQLQSGHVKIVVSRSTVFEDSFNQVSGLAAQDLKRRLFVQFRYLWFILQYFLTQSPAGTRINRGHRGTAISGIWTSRSQYRENDRDNRDKWNPKKNFKNLYFGISSRVSLFQTSSQSLQSNTIPSQAPPFTSTSRDWSHLLN